MHFWEANFFGGFVLDRRLQVRVYRFLLEETQVFLFVAGERSEKKGT